MNSRKLILYIAMSLDGYIAGPDDDLSWLSLVEKKGEDYGYQKFISSVDTVILGKRTYDKVMSMVPTFPHSDKECYVITRTPQEHIGNVKFYTGNLKELVTKLKSKEDNNIFCDGGAQVVTMLLKEKLIDEIIVSIIPIVLGDGIRLFHSGILEQQVQLVGSQSFDTGLVQLHYKFK